MSGHPENKSQEGDVVFEIHVADVDKRALYDRAKQSFLDKGATAEEAQAFLGSDDNINYDACIREIIYPTKLADISGKIHIDAAYVPDNAPLLRRSNIVHASTGHLSSKELQSIEDLFGISANNGRRTALETVHYGPIYLSPKDYGFYARIPDTKQDDFAWDDLTPEMRALVEAAVRQNASTIEFDSDECPIDILYYGE